MCFLDCWHSYDTVVNRWYGWRCKETISGNAYDTSVVAWAPRLSYHIGSKIYKIDQNRVIRIEQRRLCWLLMVSLTTDKLFCNTVVMAKDECCREHSLQAPNEFPTVNPTSIVSQKPTMCPIILKVLPNVILICRPDECTIFRKIDLHNA